MTNLDIETFWAVVQHGTMTAAAEALDFETAAALRDQIKALSVLSKEQRVIAGICADTDVWGAYTSPARSGVAVLHIENGDLLARQTEVFPDAADSEDALLSAVVPQYYLSRQSLPREILLPAAMEDADALAALLTERSGHAVAVRVPQVIRTVRKDRWEVPHAFRVGRIGWMFQMVPLPISTGRSKLWMLTRWWSEGTSRCISTSVRSPIRNPTNGCANSAAAKSIASSSMMMTFSKCCLRSDEKGICLCRVFSLKCPICGSFWHFRKMISVICGSLPRKISSRGY